MTFPRSALALALALITWSSPAFAQSADDFDPNEDDEFEFEDLADPGADKGSDSPSDAEGEDDSERIEEDDDLDMLGDPDDEEIESFEAIDEDEEDEPFDLLDGEEDASEALPGQDTAATYRDALSRFGKLEPDEELQSWEIYLAQYPKTLFRKAIDQRMEEVMGSLYGTRIGGKQGSVDALNAEVALSTGMLLENINPRTRLAAAFEWGLPDYINLAADYEHALSRTFSIHAGVRNRYSGWSIEPGVHWALVKSTRTQTLVTFIGDFHFNTNPAYGGIRPQIAFGKRFGDRLDLQAQFGPDLEFRQPFDVRIVGGANATVRASEVVGIFLETMVHMKNFNWDDGAFTFNTVTFGMKFYPGANDQDKANNVEANFGATVPYARNYWQYHFGSLMGQANIFLD
jgi:hypothetical protein